MENLDAILEELGITSFWIYFNIGHDLRPIETGGSTSPPPLIDVGQKIGCVMPSQPIQETDVTVVQVHETQESAVCSLIQDIQSPPSKLTRAEAEETLTDSTPTWEERSIFKTVDASETLDKVKAKKIVGSAIEVSNTKHVAATLVGPAHAKLNIISKQTSEVSLGAALAEQPVLMLDWKALKARVTSCTLCSLCKQRTNTVFGVGDEAADWMLVGEAPGENEDKQGEPFVGPAGQLLNNMLLALQLQRGDNVYIANVLKCRPPKNRNPKPDEVMRCELYLQRQVALVRPVVIIALGCFAAQSLLKMNANISFFRGRVHEYVGIPVVVTYHPAYLLRSLDDKHKAWSDLCLARKVYRQHSVIH
ncbi:uracil-DNA glycosylase [Candidatus Vallotia cooleyia]|uniref:uracil-DNA glycosylase n=1 Tax=Candidatus Vallotiella adelgis TaxID=1177211 RepID=UPI001D0345B8|nr:uracil-DNA glycosylase [Candidatus Vallotia cooleyia]UDG82647.1 uracil-DNA glycosylase [Candidatus Vallotia cooleyia]